MPLWLLALGRFYLDTKAVKIPYLNIFLLLLPILIPTAAGVIIRRFWPKIADKISWFSRLWSVFFVIFVVGFGMYVNWYMFELIGSQAATVIPPSMLLPTLGYVIAFGIAKLARRKWKEAVTISIETGIQNAAIPIIILQGSFPQPEGDLAAVMPVATSLFFAVPLVLVWVVYTIWKRTRPDSKNKDSKNADEQREQDDTTKTEIGTLESRDDTARIENGTLESGLDGSKEVTRFWKVTLPN